MMWGIRIRARQDEFDIVVGAGFRSPQHHIHGERGGPFDRASSSATYSGAPLIADGLQGEGHPSATVRQYLQTCVSGAHSSTAGQRFAARSQLSAM